MEKMMHLAAQYLAAAGISFVEKKADDSHTNLGFSLENGSMYSRPLNEAGDTLSLNYNNFELQWNTQGSSTSFGLDGSTHKEVVRWVEEMAAEANIASPYVYAFHYDMPYTITDDFTFKLLDIDRLKDLMHLRILAQLVLMSFLEQQGLTSEIRTWPHHFDTGAYAPLKDETGRAVGLGLSIPDTMVNDHYFYISGYTGHDAVGTYGFPPLTNGKWYTDGFKGAILPATGVDKTAAAVFFQETLEAYKN